MLCTDVGKIEHHQGFNSSIGTYHSIMRSITNSQTKVRSLREKLLTAKRDLTSDRPEVKNLALESQRYEDMLQILTTMYGFFSFLTLFSLYDQRDLKTKLQASLTRYFVF